MQRHAPLLTFIQSVLCSSLQLWIAVLTWLADSMWQLVIPRQCTSKHDLWPALEVPLSGYCRSTAAPGPVCGTTSEASCLQEGRWLLWMQGSECAAEERTLHTLMRPSSLFLVFITQQSGKCVHVSERNRNYMSRSWCGAYVQCLCVEFGVGVCDFVCVWWWWW